MIVITVIGGCIIDIKSEESVEVVILDHDVKSIDKVMSTDGFTEDQLWNEVQDFKLSINE